MNNIQRISDAYLCSNCGACYTICDANAIDFNYSPIGRMYANVNSNCIDCGLCTKVCPSIDYYNLHKVYKDTYKGEIKKVYVGKSLTQNFFQNGQSGGLCTSILAWLFENKKIDGAIVCKMDFGKIPLVQPYLVTSIKDLEDSQKSCYTPVPLLKALKQTKGIQSIALVGLPCHIEGATALNKTLKKFTNIKYKIGLICDRTLCNGIQTAISSFAQTKENDEIKIDWRRKDSTINNKYYSYSNAPVVIYTKKKVLKVLPKNYRMLLKEMFTTPRCYICYDKLNVHADIVIGDPHGTREIDKTHGNSLVLVRTELGLSCIQKMINQEKIKLVLSNEEDALRGQGIDTRKISVNNFAKALEILSEHTESYLYNFDSNKITRAELSKAKRIIREFIKNDHLETTELIKQAHNKIIKGTKIVPFYYRVAIKLKRMLWRR